MLGSREVSRGGILPVKQGVMLCGKLVDMRLKIIEKGLVLFLSSLPGVSENDFELYRKDRKGENHSVQLSKRLRRLDSFCCWSLVRVTRKTPTLRKDTFGVLNDLWYPSGKAVRAAGLFENRRVLACCFSCSLRYCLHATQATRHELRCLLNF